MNDLIKTAQRLYGHARQQFSVYGDREALYLQADVLFAEMIATDAPLEDLGVRLREYEHFIDGTGLEDIASYPQLHFFRWHMLRYYRALAEGGALAPQQADEHLAAARTRLRRVIELDTEIQNEYGLLRAELLTLLLGWVKAPPSEAELRSLSQRAAERGYLREQRLLDHLAAQGQVLIHELRDVLRFYPFVGQ